MVRVALPEDFVHNFNAVVVINFFLLQELEHLIPVYFAIFVNVKDLKLLVQHLQLVGVVVGF